MKALDWLKNPMQEKMCEKLLSTLCTNSLALSGFSFASLAIFLGFYKEDFSEASIIIRWLMIAAVLFLISSELAREASSVGEYLASEFLYYFSSIAVFYGFISFAWINLVYVGFPIVCLLIFENLKVT